MSTETAAAPKDWDETAAIRQAVERAAQLAALMRTHFETSAAAAIVVDRSGKIIEANAEARRLTGRDPVEDTVYSLMEPETAESHIQEGRLETGFSGRGRNPQRQNIHCAQMAGPDGGLLPIKVVIVSPADGRADDLCIVLLERVACGG